MVDTLKYYSGLIVITAVFVGAPGFAEVESDDGDSQRNFELPGADVAVLDGDGGLDVADVDFVGNPAKSWFEKWPADLVVAPIPGRSPQLGWKLTLAGGYFLGGRDEESDTPPSIVGGFAMVAENGSNAYGAGGNFHLLDDKLRIKVGEPFTLPPSKGKQTPEQLESLTNMIMTRVAELLPESYRGDYAPMPPDPSPVERGATTVETASA